jgi:hypothetical protein
VGGNLRKISASRRNDVRYHSNPVIPAVLSSTASYNNTKSPNISSPKLLQHDIHHNHDDDPTTFLFRLDPTSQQKVLSLITESFIDRSLAIPVSERRKFFERVAEYNTSF